MQPTLRTSERVYHPRKRPRPVGRGPQSSSALRGSWASGRTTLSAFLPAVGVEEEVPRPDHTGVWSRDDVAVLKGHQWRSIKPSCVRVQKCEAVKHHRGRCPNGHMTEVRTGRVHAAGGGTAPHPLRLLLGRAPLGWPSLRGPRSRLPGSSPGRCDFPRVSCLLTFLPPWELLRSVGFSLRCPVRALGAGQPLTWALRLVPARPSPGAWTWNEPGGPGRWALAQHSVISSGGVC